MNHSQLNLENQKLIKEQPNYYMVGGIAGLIKFICSVLGYPLLILGFAIIISSPVSTFVMKLFLPDDLINNTDTIKASKNLLTGIAVISIFCGLFLLFIVWLTKAIRKRNGYIIKQKEFINFTLNEYEVVEKAASFLGEERMKAKSTPHNSINP